MRSQMHLYQSIAAAIMQLGQLARPAKAFLIDLGRTQKLQNIPRLDRRVQRHYYVA